MAIYRFTKTLILKQGQSIFEVLAEMVLSGEAEIVDPLEPDSDFEEAMRVKLLKLQKINARQNEEN